MSRRGLLLLSSVGADVEAFFRAEEAAARPRVEESLHLFIHTGAWPDDLAQHDGGTKLPAL